MEELFKKYMLALSYVASLDMYPGCELEDAETIKKVLADQPSTQKKIESLLLEKQAEKEYDIDSSKKDLSEFPDIATLLFHESNTLESFDFLKEMPESKQEISAFSTVPNINTPMEEILTKININNLKIKYVRAQNQLLQLYIQTALEKLRPPTEGETKASLFTKLLDMYPNLNEPVGIIDTIEEFLAEAPCSLHETEFLRSILREYELRNKKL